MPNRVRKQTVNIRNQTLADLKRIYATEWDNIGADIELIVNDMYLDTAEATHAARINHADINGNRKRMVKKITDSTVEANAKAIERINRGMDKIYTVNANDIASYIDEKTGIQIFTKDVTIQSKLGKFTKRRYNKAVDNKYVSKQVMKEITNMLTSGDGTRKIAQRLQKVYNFNRTSAFRTTLTETTRIQSKGRLDTMQEAAKQGFVFKKIWRHGDYVADPRDWHLSLAGKMVNLDKPFVTELGNKMMHPGDAAGGAEETINCHCYLDEELVDW